MGHTVFTEGRGLGISHEARSPTVSSATPSVHLASKQTLGREHGRFSQGDAAPKGAYHGRKKDTKPGTETNTTKTNGKDT